MCPRRVRIFCQSLNGFRQLLEDAPVSNAADVPFRRPGYDDLVCQTPKSDFRLGQATPPPSR